MMDDINYGLNKKNLTKYFCAISNSLSVFFIENSIDAFNPNNLHKIKFSIIMIYVPKNQRT